MLLLLKLRWLRDCLCRAWMNNFSNLSAQSKYKLCSKNLQWKYSTSSEYCFLETKSISVSFSQANAEIFLMMSHDIICFILNRPFPSSPVVSKTIYVITTLYESSSVNTTCYCSMQNNTSFHGKFVGYAGGKFIIYFPLVISCKIYHLNVILHRNPI
jgi:hypothetical protein